MTMDINAGFSKRTTGYAASTPWVPTPLQGVDRRKLDRIGGEVARAIKRVRYVSGSSFSTYIYKGSERTF